MYNHPFWLLNLLFSLFWKFAVQLFLLWPATAAGRSRHFSSYNRMCLPITCEHEAWCLKKAFAHAMLYSLMYEKGARSAPLHYASARKAPPSTVTIPQLLHLTEHLPDVGVTGPHSGSRSAENLTKTLPYLPPCRISYEGSSGKWHFIYWRVLELFNSYTSCTSTHVTFILMLAVVKLGKAKYVIMPWD